MTKLTDAQIVSMIKKMALDFFPGSAPEKINPAQPPAATAPPANTTTPAPVPGTDSFMGPPAPPKPVSFADIVTMQKELISLAKTVTDQVGASTLQAPPGSKPTSVPTGEDPSQDQKEAAGRLAFSNFITQHYISQSNLPAVEFDPNPKITNVDEKQPTKPKRMNVVMDTMSRVGGGKNEFKTDGNWGPRTNAALRNAYALGFALLKMAKDFHYAPHAYTQGNLDRLKNLIPMDDKKISLTTKITNAKKIIPNITGIHDLFNEVKEHILQKPAYRSYIEGTQPYATYQNDQSANISPELIQDLDKKFTNMKITGRGPSGKNVSVPITVSNLADAQTFEVWLQKNLPSVAPEEALSQLKKHLDNTDPSRTLPSNPNKGIRQ